MANEQRMPRILIHDPNRQAVSRSATPNNSWTYSSLPSRCALKSSHKTSKCSGSHGSIGCPTQTESSVRASANGEFVLCRAAGVFAGFYKQWSPGNNFCSFIPDCGFVKPRLNPVLVNRAGIYPQIRKLVLMIGPTLTPTLIQAFWPPPNKPYTMPGKSQ